MSVPRDTLLALLCCARRRVPRTCAGDSLWRLTPAALAAPLPLLLGGSPRSSATAWCSLPGLQLPSRIPNSSHTPRKLDATASCTTTYFSLLVELRVAERENKNPRHVAFWRLVPVRHRGESCAGSEFHELLCQPCLPRKTSRICTAEHLSQCVAEKAVHCARPRKNVYSKRAEQCHATTRNANICGRCVGEPDARL